MTTYYKYIPSLTEKIREHGLKWFIKTGATKFFRDIFPKLLSPLLILPSILLRMLGVRFLPIVHLHAIGHLTVEPDCYIKEEVLGLHPSYKAILLAPRHKTINPYLLKYWQCYIRVITSPVLCALLYPLSRQTVLQFDIDQYIMNTHGTAKWHSINAKWAGKPPLLTLKKEDRERGLDCLRRLRIPEGAWFVCIHARESGGRPQDAGHTYRNVDIDTYAGAIEAVVERGGWCIRMGDPSMKPLPPMKNVIDYAHHSFRSDWMDLFLCAEARFFMGCASGLNGLPAVFGVPCALTNMFPITERPPRPNDIMIPKMMWFIKDERYMTFREMLDFHMGFIHRPDSYYIDAGIKVIDNSPEDIRSLVIEMLDLTEGKKIYTPKDELLHKAFDSLYRPGHYSYGANSRIGRDFLHKYNYLL